MPIYKIERQVFMLTLFTILGMFCGYEGYDDGKVYFGIYTPNAEYGYVIKKDEIYLDTVYVKDYNVKHNK
jgi:AAA+ superfamily predicted ATPase